KKAREKRERAELKKKQMAAKRSAVKEADNLVDNVFGKMKHRDAAAVLGDMEKQDRRVSRAR
ncbi:unnamed protein product, partial [Choristocarpus tenellus]